MLSLDDTIAAIASAPGGAARGIVRLSGPRMVEVVASCFDGDGVELNRGPLAAAHVFPGRLRAESRAIPVDLFLWPDGRSYTRQPLAEIHTFGSPPLLDAILRSVCLAGARLAQPGEFTLRAFLAGRIDLTQAEAVLGVIDAADHKQLQVALAQLAGGLARPLEQLRSELLDLLADLEAGLDFVEDDIRFVTSDELRRRLAAAARTIDCIATQLAGRETSAVRPRVVLVGRPNAGKSSLFNALVGDRAALVSTQAGTTRDYLIATIDANGLPIELIDTAGISDSFGSAENSTGDWLIFAESAEQKCACPLLSGGVFNRADSLPSNADSNRTREIDGLAQTAAAGQSTQSDLRLLCIDSTGLLNAWERSQLIARQTVPVITKCDQTRRCEALPGEITTSIRDMTGIDRVRAAIHAALAASPGESSVVAGTAARAKESIALASMCLTSAIDLAARGAAEELVAAEVRSTLGELGKIVGAIYTDDLLDRIFSRFCIGK